MLVRPLLLVASVAALFSLSACGSGGSETSTVSATGTVDEAAASEHSDLLRDSSLAYRSIGYLSEYLFSQAFFDNNGMVPCSIGSVSGAGSDLGSDGVLSTGDLLSLSFAGCRNAARAVTYTGDVDLYFGFVLGSGVSGVVHSFDNIESTYTNFTVKGNFGTTVTNGALLSSYSLESTGRQTRSGATNDTLPLAVKTGNQTWNLSNQFKLVEVQDSDVRKIDLSGTYVGSGTVETEFTVTTNSDLLYYAGYAYPESGMMTLEEADGRAVQLEWLGGGVVAVSVDPEGDGTFEAYQSFSNNDFSALAD